MDNDVVFLPVTSHRYHQLLRFLDAKRINLKPSQVIGDAIDYWMENCEWKLNDLVHQSAIGSEGFQWQRVFLPDGTKIRMKYHGNYHNAKVIGSHIVYEEQRVSPSEFANKVTGTSRNAWRDVEVLTPGASGWVLADVLRNKT